MIPQVKSVSVEASESSDLSRRSRPRMSNGPSVAVTLTVMTQFITDFDACL